MIDTSAKKINIAQITQDLLEALDTRSRDIISRRFGLAGNEPETLEHIGQEYGITRERVRQIESNAKKTLAKFTEKLAPVDRALHAIFSVYGGLLAENHISRLAQDELGESVNANQIHFYLEILPHYSYVTKSHMFHPFWSHEHMKHNHVEHVVDAAKNILKNVSKPQFFKDLSATIRQQLSDHEQELLEKYIEAALVASKDIDTTAFGQWGLTEWAEVAPRGVADKAYAVLRNHGQPVHFRDITEMINVAQFDHKKANPQTVHNELIKDKRFVLVGRGLYGLKEWGYMTGTVADVLEDVLKKKQSPMTKEELIDEVLKQRIVKKNTILLSLQNTKRFTRLDRNQYELTQK